MTSKVLLGLLWIGFIGYAFVFAPPDQPDTFTLIQNLSTGQWNGINPLIVALFNVMGVWPILYCAVLMADGDTQKLRAWPFAAASMAVGAFAILPYLIFRKPHGDWSGTKTLGLRIWDWRGWGAIALTGAIFCFGFGFTQGNWVDFVQQWQTNRFIHVMSLDFWMLSVLFPILVRDDMARRGMSNSSLWVLTMVPLLGPCLYVLLRSGLGTKTESFVLAGSK
jgi:hypothetical protein